MTDFPAKGDNFRTLYGPRELHEMTLRAYGHAIAAAQERGDKELAQTLIEARAKIRRDGWQHISEPVGRIVERVKMMRGGGENAGS